MKAGKIDGNLNMNNAQGAVPKSLYGRGACCGSHEAGWLCGWGAQEVGREDLAGGQSRLAIRAPKPVIAVVSKVFLRWQILQVCGASRHELLPQEVAEACSAVQLRLSSAAARALNGRGAAQLTGVDE
jgi:hypothetical protein